MKYGKYDKAEVIEPEILDENGRKINASREPVQETVKRELNPLRRALMGVLGAVSALLSGFMMLCVFLVVFVFTAVPVLVLSIFGKKPNVKVFKYRI